MVVDRLDVGSKIEQAPHPGYDSRQQTDVGKADADTYALSIGQVGYLYASHCPTHLNGAQVTPTVDHFDARNRAGFQKADHTIPVIGWAIAKPKCDVLLFMPHGVLSPQR